jgi:hypothetical protein
MRPELTGNPPPHCGPETLHVHAMSFWRVHGQPVPSLLCCAVA